MTEQISMARYTSAERLSGLLDRRQRMFRGVVARSAELFGESWLAAFDEMLARLFPDDEALALAAEGYASFSLDSMRLQIRFESERAYPKKTLDEIALEVTQNEAFMLGQYLPGLLLSHYLWQHHYRQLEFFEAEFVSEARARPAAFAEIGVGTGIYSRYMLRALPSARGVGFDLSPYSKAFAERHLAGYDVLARYELLLRDAVAEPPAETFRWIVCVELLEHLEDPVVLLEGIRAMLAPDGKAFITAAVNAAHADHIYLYESCDAVAEHLRRAGFTIERSFCVDAYPPHSEGQPVPAAAAFVVAP